MQVFLQGSRLNFLTIAPRVNQLIDTLQQKAANPYMPGDSYYAKVDDFISMVSVEAGGVRQVRSSSLFNKETFQAEFI